MKIATQGSFLSLACVVVVLPFALPFMDMHTVIHYARFQYVIVCAYYKGKEQERGI